MHVTERLAALKKRGVTQSSIAKDLGVAQATVGQVIRSDSRSARIEARVAEAIGLPASEIWPEWHGGIKSAESSHPAVDPSLMGEIRARCRHYGLKHGCDQPYAVPKLRHVIGVYNVLRGKLTGSETVEIFNRTIEAALEMYAMPFHDKEDPELFKRGWWEPMDSFKVQ
ncbi:MAG: helix-turn-helix domain-containing protein [Burkholderiaceae bacterium]